MTSIFVAKLDFGVSQEELKSAFERFGRVNKATIATDKETGKPRGFAFVEMFNEDEAEQAIKALDGSSFNGRQVAVKKAEDRGNSKDHKSDFKKPQFGDRESRPANRNNEQTSSEFKAPITTSIEPELVKFEARKKEAPKKKEKAKDFSDGKPKAQKMQAYKKSGKNNRFFDVDDEDDF
jgi:RNA recognition motif-containing protein